MKGPHYRWDELALPLLRYIGEHESDLWRKVQFDVQLAAEADLGDKVDEVNHELRRLIDDGYIDFPSEPRRLQTGTQYFGLGLTGQGARTIGQWPPNDLVAALQSYIDWQIDQTESNKERRQWKRLKQAIGDLAPHLIGAVISSAVSAVT